MLITFFDAADGWRLSCQATATAAKKLAPWWKEIGDKSSNN